MTQYLISFDDGAMDHIPAEDLPDVGKASHMPDPETDAMLRQADIRG